MATCERDAPGEALGDRLHLRLVLRRLDEENVDADPGELLLKVRVRPAVQLATRPINASDQRRAATWNLIR